MLRARLAASLAFNVVLAVWVLHDARARRARKPLFAAALALLWGPLGLGFWASERPLRAEESRRGGTAWTFAKGFLAGWAAMLPAVFVLSAAAMRDRAGVAGSLAQQHGVTAASVLATLLLWGAPAVLALGIGSSMRTRTREPGSPLTPGASVGMPVAAALAGLAALACAWGMTR